MTAPVIIDDPDNGGSEPGAWAKAIRDTPGLEAVEYVARERDARETDENG